MKGLTFSEQLAARDLAEPAEEIRRRHGCTPDELRSCSDLYARICALAFCGLRQGELGALGWGDLEELADGGGSRVVVPGRIRRR